MADAAMLADIRVKLHAVLDFLEAMEQAQSRRCADCNRRSGDLAECADGKWRGPTCRTRYDAGAGVQLPMDAEQESGDWPGAVTTTAFQDAGLL